MAITYVKEAPSITFFCKKCGTEFGATYPSWHKTETGKSCPCPICKQSCFQRD